MEDSRGSTHFCAVREKSFVEKHQDFFLGSVGGFVTPVHSKIGQEMRIHFERLVSWYERKQLIPVYVEDNIFFFYLRKSENHRNQYCEQFSAAV